MAPRKSAVAEPTAPVVDLGLGAEDVELPRLSIVGKLSKAVDHGTAVPGNIVIGLGADDDEPQVFDAKDGKEKVRAYVLDIHANYSCSFKDKDANPELAGVWEEGDESMPPEAKRQFNYMLFIPQHSTILPVKYTASSTAAREARRMNSRLQTEALGGKQPFETCIEISTKTFTSGNYSWPGPVFALGEPNKDEVVQAQQMHEMLFGPARQQLDSGDKPSL